jgi:hypothetical protein
VELAMGDTLCLQAEEDWRIVYYLIAGGQPMDGLSDAGRIALESLGPIRELGQRAEDYVKTTVKEKFFKERNKAAMRSGMGQKLLGAG